MRVTIEGMALHAARATTRRAKVILAPKTSVLDSLHLRLDPSHARGVFAEFNLGGVDLEISVEKLRSNSYTDVTGRRVSLYLRGDCCPVETLEHSDNFSLFVDEAWVFVHQDRLLSSPCPTCGAQSAAALTDFLHLDLQLPPLLSREIRAQLDDLNPLDVEVMMYDFTVFFPRLAILMAQALSLHSISVANGKPGV